ncbi:hypothetical protein SVAN01_07397 [Stagonosporopsis vannaccii]|nr:hypothetical protein SVAN01_07397 [Stagonosporopsis vannaccii]
MFHFRWLKRSTSKPFYYTLMNPEERVLWEIIGQEKTKSYFTSSGKIKTRKLSKEERARNQKVFFDTRCGKEIVGDDWMRMELPRSGASAKAKGSTNASETLVGDGSERPGRSAGE